MLTNRHRKAREMHHNIACACVNCIEKDALWHITYYDAFILYMRKSIASVLLQRPCSESGVQNTLQIFMAIGCQGTSVNQCAYESTAVGI